MLLYNYNMSIRNRDKAILLRREGKTYTQISSELGISKSSVSLWLKNYKLTESELAIIKENTKNRVEKGRMKSKISIRSRKVFADKTLYEQANKIFLGFVNEAMFCYGLGLYEGHGNKTSNYYSFTHKNPEIHKIMLVWMNKYLSIDKEKLKFKIYLGLNDDYVNTVDFWSQYLDIPEESIKVYAYKRGDNDSKKGDHTKGIMSVMYNDVSIILKVLAWQKMLIKYYG